MAARIFSMEVLPDPLLPTIETNSPSGTVKLKSSNSSVFYKACIQVAISLGLPANLMKLATAVLFLIILILGNKQKGGAEHA